MNRKQNQAPVSEAERLLAQYRTRLAAEGWIKSALCGLTVGFALNLVYAILSLVFGIKMYWIGPVAFLLGTATTPLFYFGRFRNSLRQVASRVDTLGLEERVLTMTQLEGDESFMARRQREDTMAALKKVNASLIKLAVSVPLIAACATTAAVSVSATTADALVDESLIKLAAEAKDKGEAARYTIKYGVRNGVGGQIVGQTEQEVDAGSFGAPVQAIADDGYVFVGWTDGVEDAFRADADIKGDFTVFAVFVEIDENDLEDSDPNPNDPTDIDGGGKKDPSDGGQKGPAEVAEGDDKDGDGGGDDIGAGGSSAPGNQYIDGKTFYGDEYGDSLSNAQNATNGNTDLSDGQSDTIGDYFNNIAK